MTVSTHLPSPDPALAFSPVFSVLTNSTQKARTNFKLDKHFHATISDPALTPLLAVMKALLRFRPSDRMEASAALDLLKSYDQHQGKKPVV